MLRLIHRLEMLVKVKTWVSIWSLVGLLEWSRIFMVFLWWDNSGWVLHSPSLWEFLNLEIWVRSQLSFLPNLKMILLHDGTQIWVELILVTSKTFGGVSEVLSRISRIFVPCFQFYMLVLVVYRLLRNGIIDSGYWSHPFLVEHRCPVEFKGSDRWVYSEVVFNSLLWAQQVWSWSHFYLCFWNIILGWRFPGSQSVGRRPLLWIKEGIIGMEVRDILRQVVDRLKVKFLVQIIEVQLCTIFSLISELTFLRFRVFID